MLRVLRILAPNPGVYTLEGTNTWILGEDPSVVIDPGPVVEEHLATVAREAGPTSLILVTHDHEDHAEGAGRLSELLRAPIHSFASSRGGRRTRDDEDIRAGDVALRAVHAPGHTPDHMVFFAPAIGALFTGDAVLGRGTSVIDPPEGDLAAYMKSLERMRELRARVIYPGHGPAVFDAAAKLEEYRRHREQREEQVLAALADGPATIDEMVEGIYAEYPEDVRPLAARSVLAQLEKLRAEGRVSRRRRDGTERWAIDAPRACARCGQPVTGRAKFCGRCSLAVLQEGPASP